MAKTEATVEELVSMIERGKLRLPEMQRRNVPGENSCPHPIRPESGQIRTRHFRRGFRALSSSFPTSRHANADPPCTPLLPCGGKGCQVGAQQF
jgi:hypothetical protein